MLDDLKLLHERDTQDALGIVEHQWQQLSQEFTVDQSPVDVDNIVYAGMGGSAIAMMVVSKWLGDTLPVEIVREYDIPAYVSERTYFIAVSSSGNTEETISAVEQAVERGAKIAVIAGGGRLAEIAKARNYPILALPNLAQARYALFYNIKALLTLLDTAGLVKNSGAFAELATTAQFLSTTVTDWEPTIPATSNLAKQIALDTIGNSAVVYSGPQLSPAAYKWKISLNENAKQVAWANQLPEFSHNEFMGWTQQPTQKPYAVIELRSELEHTRVQKRFELTERLLSGKRPAPIVVQVQGKTLLEQLLWSIVLGDFVSVYAALLSGIDPAPVALVEKFKKGMDE